MSCRFVSLIVVTLDETAAMGGRMFAQAHSRSLSALLSFKTQMPFDRLPVWKDIRKLPSGEQLQKLRDPELRRKLVETSGEHRVLLRKEVAALAAEYETVAGHLSAKRKAAAEKLSRRVESELASLAMENTRVEIRISPAEWSTAGADAVETSVRCVCCDCACAAA